MPLARISMTLSVFLAVCGHLAQGDWPRVASGDGGYSVTMPGKVEKKTQAGKGDAGPTEVHALMSEFEGVLYLATETVTIDRITPDKHEAYFARLRETYATAGANKLQKEQTGTFQGMPMCYFRFSSTNDEKKPIVIQARFLIADPTHLYSLQVFIPKGVDANADVKRFFDSLKRAEAGNRPITRKKDKATADDDGPGPAIAPKWRPFTPAGQGFTVSMPGDPKSRNQDDPKLSMKLDTYAADLGDRLFTAICYEFAAAIDPKVLETMCKDMATGMKGTVVELKPVEENGLEGQEILFEFAGPDHGKPAIGRARAFVAGKHAYVVMFNGPRGTDDREDVRKFLNSFRLTGSAKAKAKGKTGTKP